MNEIVKISKDFNKTSVFVINRSILTSTVFFETNGNILRQTNMHLLLKLKDGSKTPCTKSFQIQNYLRLPHKCKTTNFNIQKNNVSSQHFSIFSDTEHDVNTTESMDSNIFFECNVILKGIKPSK